MKLPQFPFVLRFTHNKMINYFYDELEECAEGRLDNIKKHNSQIHHYKEKLEAAEDEIIKLRKLRVDLVQAQALAKRRLTQINKLKAELNELRS